MDASGRSFFIASTGHSSGLGDERSLAMVHRSDLWTERDFDSRGHWDLAAYGRRSTAAHSAKHDMGLAGPRNKQLCLFPIGVTSAWTDRSTVDVTTEHVKMPRANSRLTKRLAFVAAYKKLCVKHGCFILCEGEELEVFDDAKEMTETKFWGIDTCKGTPGRMFPRHKE